MHNNYRIFTMIRSHKIKRRNGRNKSIPFLSIWPLFMGHHGSLPALYYGYLLWSYTSQPDLFMYTFRTNFFAFTLTCVYWGCLLAKQSVKGLNLGSWDAECLPPSSPCWSLALQSLLILLVDSDHEIAILLTSSCSVVEVWWANCHWEVPGWQGQRTSCVLRVTFKI